MASNELRLQVLLELRDKALAPLMGTAKGNDKLIAGLTATQSQPSKLGKQKSAIDTLHKLQEKYKSASNTVSVARAQLTMLRTLLPANAKEQRAHAAAIKKAEDALQKATGVQTRHRESLVNYAKDAKEQPHKFLVFFFASSANPLRPLRPAVRAVFKPFQA